MLAFTWIDQEIKKLYKVTDSIFVIVIITKISPFLLRKYSLGFAAEQIADGANYISLYLIPSAYHNIFIELRIRIPEQHIISQVKVLKFHFFDELKSSWMKQSSLFITERACNLFYYFYRNT